MQQTTNYNLNKFDSTDELESATRLGLNENADTIDTALKGIQDDIDGLTAAEVSYDNTDSGLTADNVQGAIDEIGTVKEQIIAGHLYAQAVGKVVTINGWVDGLTLPAGVQKGLGILNADIPKPTTVIRTVCNCGANAYSVGEQGYFGIDSSGNVFVTAKSNGNTTIYVSCSYTGA